MRNSLTEHDVPLKTGEKKKRQKKMASVDTSLPTKPTGAAADFAAAHAAEHPLKLYGGWFCPFVQRAWIVLHEKKMAHQYIEINPYAKAADFLALNPRGLVPTLVVPSPGDKKQTRTLYESTVICEYLDELGGSGGEGGEVGLLPRGQGAEAVFARARCRLWIEHVASKVVPAFYRVLQHTPEKEYGLEEARRVLRGCVRDFVREMAGYGDDDGGKEGGPWFLGREFSLVDVVLAPWAKRLFLIDFYKEGGTGIPEGGDGEGDEEEGRVWRRWKVWFDAVVKRESVRATWSDDEMYVKAYRRYAEDTTQSEVAKATRLGTRLP